MKHLRSSRVRAWGAALLGCGIASCAVPHYMYTPTAANVPGFTQKNESAVDANLSLFGVDVMGGYAVSDRVAILGSWYYRHETQYTSSKNNLSSRAHADTLHYLRILPSLGISYTAPISQDHHLFLGVAGGFGKGRLRMSEHETFQRDSSSVTSSSALYHASLRRLYLQPEFIVKYPLIQLIASARWSGVRFGYGDLSPLDQFDVRNHHLYSFLEGAITFRITPPKTPWLRFQLQAGASIPGSDVEFDFHPLIGNIGVGIDPVALFRKKGPTEPALRE